MPPADFASNPSAIIARRMTWWESWFGEEYLDLYPHRDLDSARREAAFALAHLPPRPVPLLDLCCGSGRHALPLAESGIAAVGLDYSAPLLDLARRRDCRRLVRGDMRALPFGDGTFAAVVNFSTSFGYFVREGENRAVIAEIERVLKPGGAFLCDTFGRDYVLARLVPEEHRCCGEKDYRIRRSWNPETQRIEKEIEVRREGSTEIFRESVRAYTTDELVQLFCAAGLWIESAWGGFDESPAGPQAPRLIVLARKPGGLP
jgi:ubiquinone/menaquinone biosynthesis C-methylase UbiE